MMAMLMAIRIVEGKYNYARVPIQLKAQVKDCLETMGYTVDEQGYLVALEG